MFGCITKRRSFQELNKCFKFLLPFFKETFVYTLSNIIIREIKSITQNYSRIFLQNFTKDPKFRSTLLINNMIWYTSSFCRFFKNKNYKLRSLDLSNLIAANAGSTKQTLVYMHSVQTSNLIYSLLGVGQQVCLLSDK